MKSSLRAKRMARNHRRNSAQPKLNLVSLMDIFTILVFFLMVNSGDVEVLSSDKNISLPNSVAEKKPAETVTIKVSANDLIVQGRSIGALADGEQLSATMSALSKELVYQASRRPTLTDSEKIKGRSVVIMGDQAMPYTVLKQLMTTCSANDFRDISLAVNRVPDQRDADALSSQES